MRYEDFELRIEPLGDAGYRVSCRSTEGDTTNQRPVLPAPKLLGGRPSPKDRSSASRSELDTSTARAPGATREFLGPATDEQASALALGRGLFDAFIVDEIREKYFEALTAAKTRRAGLRVAVRINPATAAAVDGAAWETLVNGSTRIACDLSTPVVRTPEIGVPVDARRNGRRPRLRVLLVLSSPEGLPRLDLGEERTNVERATRWARLLGAMMLRVLENPTIQDLQDAFLEKDWDVLHFAGHGGHDDHGAFLAITPTLDESCLDGYRKLRSADLAMLARNEPRLMLAIFNCCHGADIGPSAAPSLAHEMLDAQVLAVVAMQDAIQDASANRFARELYRALLFGRPLEAAMTSARAALALSEDKGKEDWWIPSLYLRRGIALRIPWLLWVRLAVTVVAITAVGAWILRPPPLHFHVAYLDGDGKKQWATGAEVTVGKGAPGAPALTVGRDGALETGLRTRSVKAVRIKYAKQHMEAVCEDVHNDVEIVVCPTCLIDPAMEVRFEVRPPKGIMWDVTWKVEESPPSTSADLNWTESGGAHDVKKIDFGSRVSRAVLWTVMLPPEKDGDSEPKGYTLHVLQGGQERCWTQATLFELGSAPRCQIARGQGPRCRAPGPEE